MRGGSHDRKQRIVRRDDHRHGWIEGAVTVQTGGRGQEPDGKRKERSHNYCHDAFPCVSRQTQRLNACSLARITSAMPPRIAVEASANRVVRGSPRTTMPPSAAIAGTLSCTVAALVALSDGK